LLAQNLLYSSPALWDVRHSFQFPPDIVSSNLQLLHININGGMNRSAAAAAGGGGSGTRSNQNVETLKRGIDVY
jgi:hypothetical protein